MLKSILANLMSLLFLLAISLAYFSFVAERVPSEAALVINLILMPIVLGALGYFLIQAPFYVAIMIMAVLPIAA